MEITLDSQQNIARTIVGRYNNGEYLCIKNIAYEISEEFIHTIYNSFPALCAKKPTNAKQRDFFIVIQNCLFVYSLYRHGLILIDKSIKNEACNDYSSKGEYEYFSFKEVCGDENLGRFVCDNWSLPIIPTTDLINLVRDEFKTLEHKRVEEQLEEAKKSTCWSRKAAIIALVSLVITTVGGFVQRQNEQKIDHTQIESITTVIKEHKTVTIDSIQNMPTDTFNVKIVQPKLKPKTIQSVKPKPQKGITHKQ